MPKPPKVPYVISVWPDGANPETDEPALRVPSGVRGTVVGRVRREGGYHSIDFDPDRVVDNLRVLKANQSQEWLARWGGSIEAAIAALDNGRGAPRKVDEALEYYDSEIARDRKPTRELLHEACEEAGCQAETLKRALRERRKLRKRTPD